VTALVEGVLHAVNSETPELVLAEEFGIAYNGWNGRPVVLNHPELNGKKVSANDPEVLERHQVGRAFNTRMSSSALDTELWVDPERAAGLGKEGHRLLERIEAEDPNDPLEVSVGVFILPEARAGEYNGKKYQAVWRHIVQDHIAILSDGKVGACSVSMGCGTRWMTSADGYERVGGTVPRNDDTVPAMLAPGERMLTPEEQRAACDCGSIKLGDVKIANTIVADTIIKHVLGRR
jgi:hypothetical protein